MNTKNKQYYKNHLVNILGAIGVSALCAVFAMICVLLSWNTEFQHEVSIFIIRISVLGAIGYVGWLYVRYEWYKAAKEARRHRSTRQRA